MSQRDHLVVGPDGSGTTNFSRILRDHGGTGTVYHCPFPTARHGSHYFTPSGETRWVKYEEAFGKDAMRVTGPERKGGWALAFMDINKIDPDGKMVVWVLCRDATCSTLSCMRKRFKNNTASPEEMSPFGRDTELKRLWIEEQLEKRTGPVVFVSFETLVQWGEFYLRRIFTEGGLKPDDFNYDALDLRDENAKWRTQCGARN